MSDESAGWSYGRKKTDRVDQLVINYFDKPI